MLNRMKFMIVHCINIHYKVSKHFGVINKLHMHIYCFVVTFGKLKCTEKNCNKNPAFDSMLTKNELAMKFMIVYCIDIHFYKASKHQFGVKTHKLPTHIHCFVVTES